MHFFLQAPETSGTGGNNRVFKKFLMFEDFVRFSIIFFVKENSVKNIL